LTVAFLIPAIIRQTKSNVAAVAVPMAVATMMALVFFGQYQLSAETERHVTPWQSEQLKRLLEPKKSIFTRGLIFQAADNAEARGYAVELMGSLNYAGVPVVTTDKRMLRPFDMRPFGSVKGVFFQVNDLSKRPEEAIVLATALTDIGIRTTFWTNQDLWINDYILTVGLK
jgi:hypothetical protein